MKRFDPAYLALRELLKKQTTTLKAVNVEVHDPDFWPYTAHRNVFFGDDVPANLFAENGRMRAEHVKAALCNEPTDNQFLGHAGPLCASLVHDAYVVAG